MSTRGGRQSAFCRSLGSRLYGVSTSRAYRSGLRKLILRLEGGPMYSLTIRSILREFHSLDTGLFTIGPCEADPDRFRPDTTIGRYSSIYWTSCALRRTSPTHQLPGQRAPAADAAEPGPESGLAIGHDVFFGHNVVVLPSVRHIGDGAFVGAGSIVQADVPPYAVVTGNPARVVRYRFSKQQIADLLAEQWWLKSPDELDPDLDEFRRPLESGKPAR